MRNWASLYDRFAAFQLLLLEGDVLVGVGHTVPLAWHPGLSTPNTIDEVLSQATWPIEQGQGVLCALAAIVAPEYRRKGVSRLILQGMRKLTARKGLRGLIAPVRPTRKHEFPFEPIEEYASRRDASGRLFDPWLRVHEAVGGRQLGIAPRALTVRATVSEWEDWTGQKFPQSGDYEVPGGLVPVTIDRESDVGEYAEPNVWYFHTPSAGE